MNEGLEGLQDEGIRWVEANRSKRFSGVKKLLTDLYPDSAHFIYELLQNAEDARDKAKSGSRGASVVRFTLNKDSLEFEHDGESLFNLSDVESITGIGDSNKLGDPTSIGKFGVGFKAVFAYTNTPEIHSGEYHFRIRDLVVPEEINWCQMGERETLFRFPFNNAKKPATQAVSEISHGLKALGDNTLLFLSHIRKIEYLLPDGSLGSLERFDHKDGRVEIRACQPGEAATVSHWLRFDKNVNVTDEVDKPKTCRVAIAYNLVEEEDKKSRVTWKIVPLDQGQVSIYFPAEKETSKLRFHLHAPFASTVARDSVRDCEANKALRDHLAQLMAESLAAIRDQGLLTTGFLAVLPNPGDSLSPFYEPIRQTIAGEFKRNPLVPIRAGGHAAVAELVRCPAKFVGLSDDDISLIAGRPLRVAANPPLNNQREDQFLTSLGICDWGWKELGLALSSEGQRAAIEEWIGKKDDDSLSRWYGLLHDLKSRGIALSVGSVRIVRVRPASGAAMCRPKEVFFPLDTTTARRDDVNFVEPVFCSGESRAFLESIGVRLYDEKATIGQILEKYGPLGEPAAEHVDHIRMFISFWKKNPFEVRMFHGRSFLLGKTPEGGFRLVRPVSLYLDNPYQETLLSAYYDRLPKGQSFQLPLASRYTDEGISIEELVSFAKAVGVLTAFDVQRIGDLWNNPARASLMSGGKKKLNNDSYKRVESDFDIREFEILLSSPDLLASRLIWKTMSESVEKQHFLATYKRNNISEEMRADSRLIHRLRVASWVPQKDGRFVKPAEARSSELPAGFSFDPGQEWLKAIGFGDEEKKHSEEYRARDRMARDMGLASVDELTKYLDAIKESGLTPEQNLVAGAQRKQISQPEESVKDPQKRRRGVKEDGDSAPPKESVIRERSIQPGVPEVTATAKAYLRVKYMNSEGQLVCQCCHEEMPFKLRSGDHYFEAVQCVRDQDAHYHQNRLALCPNCAAMYQNARETDDAEIRRRIVAHGADDQAPAVDIPVRLAGRDQTLRFVGTHWFDLKTVFAEHQVVGALDSGTCHG